MNHTKLLLGTVLTTAVMVGCTSSQDGKSGEAEPSTPSASVSSSQEPSATEEPTPTVAPATGRTMSLEGTRVNIPEGWKISQPGKSSIIELGYDPDDLDNTISLFGFPKLSLMSIEEQVRRLVKGSGWDARPERLPDVMIDGTAVTHVSGPYKGGARAETFATLVGERQLELTFEFDDNKSKAKRKEIIESVLASWEFTS